MEFAPTWQGKFYHLSRGSDRWKFHCEGRADRLGYLLRFKSLITMKIKTENDLRLEDEILEACSKIEKLVEAIREIGQPAGNELQRRLVILKIECKALTRNYEELKSRQLPGPEKTEKVQALLRLIVSEEASIEHDAEFLHQSAPSSVTLVVEAAAQLVELYRRGMKRVIGDHHPLGASVFVNRTHENLESEFEQDQPMIPLV